MTTALHVIPQEIHLIGINGSGMSGLAQCLSQLSKTVSGSDLYLSDETDKLTSHGVKIYRGHSRSNLNNVKLVVASDAIPKSNSELNEARLRGIPILSRSACLNLICEEKCSVMVAGSHGKTTTAAMISWILRNADMDPSFAIGANVPNLLSQRAHIGNGEHFIVEACEAFRNLHTFCPSYAVINNIDEEHLNHYGSQEALDQAFLEFANRATNSVIVNGDDPGIQRILPQISRPIISYGLSRTNTVCAVNYQYNLNGASFEVFINGKYEGVVKLTIPGKHVLMNALASIACVLILGIDFSSIAKSLSQFTGVKRRWERYELNNQFILIDDFAHHPSQIAALADTALALRLPNQRIVIAFQPQLYSRTKSLLKEFSRELARFDQVLLFEIDGAGERDGGEISSTDLARQITDFSGKVEQFFNFEDFIEETSEILRPTDLVITAGTGEIRDLAKILSLQERSKLSPTLSKIEDPFLPAQLMNSLSSAEDQNRKRADQTVLSLLNETITAQPESSAISEGDQKLSYQKLNAAANHTSCCLYQKGLRPGDVVVVHMRPCMEAVILMISIARLGGIYLPIDPTTPVDRAQFMLDTAKANSVISKSSNLKAKTVLSFIELCDLDTSHFNASSNYKAPLIGPQDQAYICFTSGTTGKPKAVPITHGALANLILNVRDQLKINNSTKILLHTTLSFDVSLGEIWLNLCGGGELCSTGKNRPLIGESLGEFLKNKKITHLFATPSILKTIPLDSYPELECVVVAGEKCPQELVNDWAINRSFFNAYGPTEATIYSTIGQCRAGQKVTIGLPIRNVSAYIFGENFSPAADDQMGELYIGGVGLSKGYLNLLEETSSRFIKWQGEMLYRTGDLVRRLANGEIEYIGRMDHQVKILGNRIELEEIEYVITQFPEIIDAVVLVDEQNEIKSLICFAILNKAYSPDWPTLKERLAKWLPPYMLPKHFIPIQKILLTPNGKKNRIGLLSQYRHHIFERTDFTAPRTLTEKRIAEIWQRFLKIPNEIGMYEDFASMGGDSLDALELLTEIESEFQITFPPEQLVGITTIWKMAVAVDGMVWRTQPSEDHCSDEFKFSRIYKSLRYLTANWHGNRLDQDSLIVSVGNNLTPEFEVFICIQYEDELVNISQSLGDRFRVHGLRSGHLLTDYNAQDTNVICKHYVKEILKIGVSGKFILGGICQGGRIAIRINEILRLEGFNAELLMLVEQMHLLPIDGNIAFFYSKDSKLNPERRFFGTVSPYEEIYGERHQIYLIPGIHGEIHLEPQVHLMAEKLKRHLGVIDPQKHLHEKILETPDILFSSQAKLVEKSGLFDDVFYRGQFPQGYEFKFGPAYHYVSVGWHQAYDPCPFFSTTAYLKRAPDVYKKSINPLVHFLHFGIFEGREAWTQEDVIKWHQNWQNNPGLAKQVIESAQGSWPILTRVSRVNVYVHSRGHMAFQVFQDLFVQGFRAIGIETFKANETQWNTNNHNMVNDVALNIIIAPHEFFYLGGSPKIEDINWSQVVILNSEQIPSVWFRKALPYLFKASYVMDMNIQTAASLVQLGINARFIPIGYVSGSNIFAGTPETPIENRDVDLLWIGSNSERREQYIMNNERIHQNRRVCIRLVNIHDQTLRLDDPNCIGSSDFTALSQRSKILLNIHHFATPYFEWQRLIHFGLMQGCCVVTEKTTQQPGLIPGEHYFEEDLQHLPELITWLLEDLEGQKMAARVSAAGYRTAMELFQLDRTLSELFSIE